jgi:hypothetical protein
LFPLLPLFLYSHSSSKQLFLQISLPFSCFLKLPLSSQVAASFSGRRFLLKLPLPSQVATSFKIGCLLLKPPLPYTSVDCHQVAASSHQVAASLDNKVAASLYIS